MGAKNAKIVKNDAPLAERLMEEGEIRHHHDIKPARLKRASSKRNSAKPENKTTNRGSILDLEEGKLWRTHRFVERQAAVMRSNSPEKSRVVSVGDAFVVDLDNCLGEGFFGKIFLGRQKQGGERVAVKTGRPSDLMTELIQLSRATRGSESQAERTRKSTSSFPQSISS